MDLSIIQPFGGMLSINNNIACFYYSYPIILPCPMQPFVCFCFPNKHLQGLGFLRKSYVLHCGGSISLKTIFRNIFLASKNHLTYIEVFLMIIPRQKENLILVVFVCFWCEWLCGEKNIISNMFIEKMSISKGKNLRFQCSLREENPTSSWGIKHVELTLKII